MPRRPSSPATTQRPHLYHESPPPRQYTGPAADAPHTPTGATTVHLEPVCGYLGHPTHAKYRSVKTAWPHTWR